MTTRCWILIATAALLVGCAHTQETKPERDAPPSGKHPGPGHAHHHHGSDHRFQDAEKWAERFEDPARDKWQKPGQVLDMLQLEADDVVANIGSGTGYFSVRVAKRAHQGRVWGVDVEPNMVRYLNDRAREQGLDNLFSILGLPDDPMLPEPVDVAMMVDTYHHVEDRTDYFEGVADRLEKDGRLVIVDFKKGDLPVGPPDKMKLTPAEVRSELQDAGYALDSRETEKLPYQYVLIFTRASS